nr:MAG TPA: hypothetical protein [Caudoviricetes sp.]DAG28323.1 MAG TPA: hypothetical protein [Caudoviricetes sp.]
MSFCSYGPGRYLVCGDRCCVFRHVNELPVVAMVSLYLTI